MSAPSQTWVVATRGHADARVTIADVAREAGVNKGTVSRALRGVRGVGPGTRARILAAADRLNFSASHIATALATGQSRTVGMVIPTLRSWYFSDVASGASEVLIPAGFRVELINLDMDSDFLGLDSEQFRRMFRDLDASRGWDALLFAGTVLMAANRPGASGTGRVPIAVSELPLTNVPGIEIDNRLGCALIAEHLLDLGHREFTVVDGRVPGKVDASQWQQRTEGFVETVRAAGAPEPAIVYAGDCAASDGERTMQKILARGGRQPTAVFFHTDELAFGALATLRRAGVRCPADVSVAAFDDHPMSRYWGLTTVSQHAHEQGVRSALALLNALGEEPGPDHRLDVSRGLSLELVVRETTGTVPQ